MEATEARVLGEQAAGAVGAVESCEFAAAESVEVGAGRGAGFGGRCVPRRGLDALSREDVGDSVIHRTKSDEFNV